MGTIYQRSPSGPYYAQWTNPTTGTHHKCSLKTRDRKVALERLRQHELVQTNPARHSSKTLGPAIGDMLDALVRDGHPESTRSCYATHGKPLIDILGDIPLNRLSYTMLADYVELRRKPHPITGRVITTSTIKHELVTLRKTLKEAIRRQTWQGDIRAIIPTLKSDYKPRSVWLSPEQAAALIDEVGTPSRWYKDLRWRSIWTALAIYTGGRYSEIQNLRVEHVKFDEGHILIPGLKTGRAWRNIPINPELAKILRPWIKGKAPTDRIVPSWGTNPLRDLSAAMHRINARRVARARKGKLVEVWPEHITPNDLRRTFASLLCQAGVPHDRVAKLMGHGSTVMIDKVYGHLSKENLVDAIAKFPKLRKAA